MTRNKYITQISEIHKSFKSVVQTSYDIVKAHGGELKVETKGVEGFSAEASAQAGATFIILLPKI